MIIKMYLIFTWSHTVSLHLLKPTAIHVDTLHQCITSDTRLALKTLFSRAAASSDGEDWGLGRGRLHLSPGRPYRDWVAELAWHLNSLLLRPELYQLFLLLWEQPVVNLSASVWCGKKREAFKSQVRIPAAYLGLPEFIQELHLPHSTPFRKRGWCPAWNHRDICICNLAHKKLLHTLAQKCSEET